MPNSGPLTTLHAEARERARLLAELLREYAARQTGYIYADEVAVLQETADVIEWAVAEAATLREALAEIASGNPELYGAARIARVALAATAQDTHTD
jgi:hypothetical protein